MVRPFEFSPILSWSEERGEALESLYVCVYCVLVYNRRHFVPVLLLLLLIFNCTCTRSIGGPLVRITNR